MKAIYRILFTISLLVPAACNSNPKSTRAASEDVTDRMKAERNEYVTGIEARLAEFDQKIDGLEKRADAMAGTLKTNFKNSIDDLKNERKAVDVKLDDLKKVSIESWTTLKIPAYRRPRRNWSAL